MTHNCHLTVSDIFQQRKKDLRVSMTGCLGIGSNLTLRDPWAGGEAWI